MPSLMLKPIELTHEQWLQVFHVLGLNATLGFLVSEGFVDDGGTLRPSSEHNRWGGLPALWDSLSAPEKAAIEYACGEWDYAYSREPR